MTLRQRRRSAESLLRAEIATATMQEQKHQQMIIETTRCVRDNVRMRWATGAR
jgi:hypothetical protein